MRLIDRRTWRVLAILAQQRPLPRIGLSIGTRTECFEHIGTVAVGIDQRLHPGRQLARIVESIEPALADHVHRAVAQQPLRPRVEQSDGAIGIGGDHRHLIGRIDHRLQALPGLGRVLPRLLQLGHVGVGTGHPQRPALPVPLEHPATVLDPDPLAVLVAHAQQAGVVVAAPFEMVVQRRIRQRDVIGMDQFQEGLLADRFQLFQAVADDLGPARVDPHLAGLHVPLPGSRSGTVDDHRQAATLFRQLMQAALQQSIAVGALARHQSGPLPAQAGADRSRVLRPPVQATGGAGVMALPSDSGVAERPPQAQVCAITGKTDKSPATSQA